MGETIRCQIDNKLMFESHIMDICIKASREMYALARVYGPV